MEASLDVDPYDGSSPRRRGTHDEVRSDRALRRFIPAQAGNTVTDGSRSSVTTVHPRAGGEHFHYRSFPAALTG